MTVRWNWRGKLGDESHFQIESGRPRPTTGRKKRSLAGNARPWLLKRFWPLWQPSNVRLADLSCHSALVIRIKLWLASERE